MSYSLEIDRALYQIVAFDGGCEAHEARPRHIFEVDGAESFLVKKP